MSYSTAEVWMIILGLGIGTFALRFSFLGLIGGRSLSPFVLRLLRYTPVAVIPGLVAPLVLWPAATSGETDPARLMAAATTLIVAGLFKRMLLAILSGAAVLYLALWLL
jgi:branched-subunit amino acid transport protein